MSYIDHCYVDGQLWALRDKDALHSDDWIDTIFPIGFILMTANPANPSTYYGGEWVAWGQGKVPICVDPNDPDFNVGDRSGGRKDTVVPRHTHTATFSGYAMPSHNHAQYPHNHSQNQHRHHAGNNMYPATRFVVSYAGVGEEGGGAISGSGKVYPYQSSGNEWESYEYTEYATASNIATTASNYAASAGTPSGSVSVANAGQASVSNTNLQPYMTCYIWKRVQ